MTTRHITGVESGGGIPEAPNDGTQYGRQNESWTPISASLTGTPNEVVFFDTDGDATSSENFTNEDGLLIHRVENGNGYASSIRNGEFEPISGFTLPGVGIQYRKLDNTGFGVFGFADLDSVFGQDQAFIMSNLKNGLGGSTILAIPGGFFINTESDAGEVVEIQMNPQGLELKYSDDVDSPTVEKGFRYDSDGLVIFENTDEYILPQATDASTAVQGAIVEMGASGQLVITNTFPFAIDFDDVAVETVKAPVDMKIVSITAESGTPTIEVNGSPYTLEDPIDQFDEIEVTATVDTLVILNCELI